MREPLVTAVFAAPGAFFTIGFLLAMKGFDWGLFRCIAMGEPAFGVVEAGPDGGPPAGDALI